MRAWTIVVLALAVVGVSGCCLFDGPVNPVGRPAVGEPRAPEEAIPERARNAQRARERYRDMTFEEFEEQCYCEPGCDGGKYIVNGDRPILNKKQLREFFENEVQKDPGPRAMSASAELTVSSSGGRDEIWSDSLQLQLTYCVSDDFGDDYDDVVAAMEAAADAWEEAADIDFIHNSGEDGDCDAGNADVVFDLRPVDANGNYLARAFFPNDPRWARNILIDESAFQVDGELTLEGILRHELGHTLGFRHEHTRPEAGACFEDDDWRPVTDYDPFSVMHYPQCNGQADWGLKLTHRDKNGAACLYGPAPGFAIDTSLNMQNCRVVVQTHCGTVTVDHGGQLGRGQVIQLGPFSVSPGTVFEATMTGSGDPDLYVRFDQPPTTGSYDCRPYLSGASEECVLDVRTGTSQAFVMVRGYTACTFTVAVTHTRAGP